MKITGILIVLCLLAGSLAPSGAFAQNATIKGTVKFENEIAVGAAVALLQNGSLVTGQQTDGNGNFRCQGLDAGTYIIISAYSGSSDTTEVPRLDSNETRQIEIKIENSGIREILIEGGKPLVRESEAVVGASYSADDIIRGSSGRGIMGKMVTTHKVVTSPAGANPSVTPKGSETIKLKRADGAEMELMVEIKEGKSARGINGVTVQVAKFPPLFFAESCGQLRQTTPIYFRGQYIDMRRQ